jgi:STE24 endopeptidase
METVLLSMYLLVACATLWLKRLNLRHLKEKGREVPPGFEGSIDADTLRRSLAYALETSRLDALGLLLDRALVILLLFGGLLAVYDRWTASLTSNVVLAGVLFFLGLLWAETVVGLPFSLYRNFRIEARYGFNRMTGRIWLADLAKSMLISSVLTATSWALPSFSSAGARADGGSGFGGSSWVSVFLSCISPPTSSNPSSSPSNRSRARGPRRRSAG